MICHWCYNPEQLGLRMVQPVMGSSGCQQVEVDFLSGSQRADGVLGRGRGARCVETLKGAVLWLRSVIVRWLNSGMCRVV